VQFLILCVSLFCRQEVGAEFNIFLILYNHYRPFLFQYVHLLRKFNQKNSLQIAAVFYRFAGWINIRKVS
jgi:hypothetical protein